MTRSVLLRRLAVPLACVGIALAVDALVYALVFAPSHAVVDRTDSTWRGERDRIARFKTYRDAHEQVTRLAKQAMTREDLPKVVTTLAALAKRRGLSIPAVNYQPERVEVKDFQKVSLAFAVSGPYAQVRRFLDDLERSSPFLAVESLDLSGARKKSGDDLEVHVKVAAYLRTV